MILPSSNAKSIRLVRVPDDFESHEAFRHVTGLIAAVEEQNPDSECDDILAILEDHGFETVDFILGPTHPRYPRKAPLAPHNNHFKPMQHPTRSPQGAVMRTIVTS